MIVDGYVFSEKLIKLYKEVQQLRPECNINIEIVDKVPIEEENVDGLQMNLPDGSVEIYVKRNAHLEVILSHELLHAYFLRKGYPNHHYIDGDDTLIHKCGRDLYNQVIHKLILEEQLKRGFEVDKHQYYLAENLGSGMVDESDPGVVMQFALVILHCNVLCGKYSELYDQKIKESFPKSHSVAKKLYRAMIKQDFQEPEETRQAIVRVIKSFELCTKNFGLCSLNLPQNVIITFYPTEIEMKKCVNEVFHLSASSKEYQGLQCWTLVANKDNQAAFILATVNSTYSDIRNFMKNTIVQELYKESNCIKLI